MTRRAWTLSALLFAPISFVGLSLDPGSARGAELDAEGKLHPVGADATMVGFDDVAQLVDLGASLTRWKGNPWEATLVATPIVDDGVFLGRAIPSFDAPEGKGALRLGGSVADGATGLLVPGKAILARLRGRTRFAVTVWARAEGTTPYLLAQYGDGFVNVYALRTGRETSDGWAEYTTGTLDSAVWGFPLTSLLFHESSWAAATDAIAIDALEVVPIEGSGVAPVACTQANIEAKCGPEGDCQYGHCFPGYAAYGPLPPRAHREELARRWVHLALRVQGDRNAARNAKALATAGPTLAAYSIGSRQFHAGMHRLVNELRDQHTTYGYPWASFFQPISFGGGSSTIGACFGPGRHDLLAEAGLGWIVYRANLYPATSPVLRRGDALTAIDGRPPREWVHDVWGALAYSLPNDPGAEVAWSSTSLSALIERRASTIEITRCDSDVRCDGEHKEVFTVDVVGPVYQRIRATGGVGPLPAWFGCNVRFQNSIDRFAGDNGEPDRVSSQVVRGNVLGIQFDGTYGRFKWSETMTSLFPKDAPPTKVLFDTRQGNGGYLLNAQTVANLLRPKSDPIGELLLPRGGWDSANFATLIEASAPCYLALTTTCLNGFADLYFSDGEVAVGASARVAFLNAANVSANDFLARLVKGRSNSRIFSPGPTSGAFGSIMSTPAMLIGWGGASLQMQDTLFGRTWDALPTATFESGNGVVPDEVIAETMSDAIRDRDTMIERAHAWLTGSE